LDVSAVGCSRVIDVPIVIAMKAGPHANEGWGSIQKRKAVEEQSPAGAVWWGYGGSKLDPIRQVIPLCLGKRVEVAMFETSSDPGVDGGVLATEYSTDTLRWLPVPNGVEVRGSTRAIVLREFRIVNEMIDLTQYVVAVGDHKGRSVDDFFYDSVKQRRRRTEAGCLRRRERDAASHLVRVTVRATVTEPYAVYMR
jgi:hypothetical protein